LCYGVSRYVPGHMGDDLATPHPMLSTERPIDLVFSELGALRVEHVLRGTFTVRRLSALATLCCITGRVIFSIAR